MLVKYLDIQVKAEMAEVDHTKYELLNEQMQTPDNKLVSDRNEEMSSDQDLKALF